MVVPLLGWDARLSLYPSKGREEDRCPGRKGSLARLKDNAGFIQMLDISPKTKGSVQLEVATPACVASFNTCPIITVEYYLSVGIYFLQNNYSLQIKLNLKGSVNNTVKNSLPILVGTIPVYQVVAVSTTQPYPTQPSAPYPSVYPSSSIEPSAPMDTSPPYPLGPAGPQAPPPSYEESVTGGNTINTDNEGVLGHFCSNMSNFRPSPPVIPSTTTCRLPIPLRVPLHCRKRSNNVLISPSHI